MTARRTAHATLAQQENPSLSQQEAWLFAVIGSCVLFSLYVALRFFGKDVVNLLLGLYFAVIGAIMLQQTLSSLLSTFMTSVRYPALPRCPPRERRFAAFSAAALLCRGL